MLRRIAFTAITPQQASVIEAAGDQLGLMPGAAPFTHCVASLDADVQP